jgi:hypothetical protein
MFMQKGKEEAEEEEEEEREKEERCGMYIAYYQQKYYHAAMITFEAHFPLSHLLLHCSFINPHLDFHLFLFFLSSSTRRMPMTSLPTQIEGASLHLFIIVQWSW